MEWILDVALVVGILGRTLAGAGTGLAAGIVRVVGMVLGGLLGLWAGPQLASRWDGIATHDVARTLAIIGTALVGMVAGEAVGGVIGRRLRRALGPIGGLDALLGAVAALVASSLVVWLVAATLRPLLPAPAAAAVNDSRVLPQIDAIVPDALDALPAALSSGLRTQWPRVFGGLRPEPRIDAPAPEDGVAGGPAVATAAASVLRVTTDAPRCVSDAVGSGWVVAPQRVVTNAHVVAGSTQVSVQVTGRGPHFAATVVGFDPDLDLAVLAVPGLPSTPLPRGDTTGQESVVALGFPGGGDYTVSPSRIRGTLRVDGQDIHGGAGMVREVHAVRGTVRPGNSGGPLLDTDGAVVGTVFAGSTVDPQTYYALTDDATAGWLDRASGLNTAVSTQGCSVG